MTEEQRLDFDALEKLTRSRAWALVMAQLEEPRREAERILHDLSPGETRHDVLLAKAQATVKLLDSFQNAPTALIEQMREAQSDTHEEELHAG